MGFEIERKYLLGTLPPEVEGYPSFRIRQGYLVADADGTEVRLHQKDDGFYLTVKQGEEQLEAGAGLRRTEVEVDLVRAQFEALWPLTEGRRLQKTRYVLPWGEAFVEVDRFEGALAGLLTAEVEFPTLAASRAFRPPDWFGREITASPSTGCPAGTEGHGD